MMTVKIELSRFFVKVSKIDRHRATQSNVKEYVNMIYRICLKVAQTGLKRLIEGEKYKSMYKAAHDDFTMGLGQVPS